MRENSRVFSKRVEDEKNIWRRFLGANEWAAPHKLLGVGHKETKKYAHFLAFDFKCYLLFLPKMFLALSKKVEPYAITLRPASATCLPPTPLSSPQFIFTQLFHKVSGMLQFLNHIPTLAVSEWAINMFSFSFLLYDVCVGDRGMRQGPGARYSSLLSWHEILVVQLVRTSPIMREVMSSSPDWSENVPIFHFIYDSS